MSFERSWKISPYLLTQNPHNKACRRCVAASLPLLASLPFWPADSSTRLLSLELSSSLPPPNLQALPSHLFQALWDDLGSCWPVKDEWRAPAWQDELFLPYLQPQRQHMTSVFPQADFSQLKEHLVNVWTSVNSIKNEGEVQHRWQNLSHLQFIPRLLCSLLSPCILPTRRRVNLDGHATIYLVKRLFHDEERWNNHTAFWLLIKDFNSLKLLQEWCPVVAPSVCCCDPKQVREALKPPLGEVIIESSELNPTRPLQTHSEVIWCYKAVNISLIAPLRVRNRTVDGQ